MFFVDDHQAEVLELDVGLDQLVGADDQIDAAVGQPGERCLHFLRAAKARQLGDLDRPVGEAVGKILEMLLGQERRRDQDRDLAVIHQRDERGAQRHFGLAETHVAAHQPIGRFVAGQVADHGVDRRLLVGGLLERKAFGEALVIVRAELELVALSRRALRIEIEQLGRGVANLLERTRLRALPLAAAERVQRRIVGRGAAVTADQVQAADRHIELGVFGVAEVQEFRWPVAEIHRHQTQIAADPVLLMDDRIADANLRQIAQHHLDVAALAFLALRDPPRIRRVQLGFGNDQQLGLEQRKAGGDRGRA